MVMTDAVLRAAITWRAGVDTFMEDDTRVLSECGGKEIIACDWLVKITPTTGSTQRILYYAFGQNGWFSDFTPLCCDTF